MNEYCASLVDTAANLPNHIHYNVDLVPYNATKVYQRNFLTWYGEIYPGTENAKWGNFLVMDIANIKNWYMEYDEGNNFVQGTVTSSEICPGYTGAVWSYISNSIYHFALHSNNNDPLQHPDENLWVRNILVIGEDVWIGNMNPSNYGSQNLSYTYSRNPNVYQGPHTGSPVYSNGDTGDNPKMFQKGQHSWLAYPTYPTPELPDSNTVASETGNVSTAMVDYEVCTNDMVIQTNFHYSDDYWGADKTDTNCIADTVCTQLGTVLKMQSWCGLMFHFQDKYYKPIVSGGVITGYTDDMTQESDWDDITNVTGNNISPTPPGPAPGPGDDDPWDGVDFGGSSGGGGAFAKFYYMTSTELANLRSWMNSNNVPEGFNPMAQIIGLSQLPVAISGSDSENVMFVNSAAIYTEGQNRVVDTGVATQRGLGRTIVFNLGSVEIPRRMQQRGEPYLDYSCAIELYLPFCGVFSLDTQAVMGRTITAQLVLDPTSGSVIAYAWVSESGQKLPVAYGSGQVGVDLPITAQQYGMSKAALSQANAAFSQSILQTAF
ncbi:MAG: hypothetical protein J6S85_25895 [Methanobrevibacter sp.]|nr:hypothetical protein [Methanobrevibacter sp.]